MDQPLRVLLVDDSETDSKLVAHELRRAGRHIDAERVDTAVAMRSALAHGRWDVIISDWAMPVFSAVEALGVLKESRKDIPFIIVSGTIGEETAVAALRAGACDFLVKDKLTRLLPAIERELRDTGDRQSRRTAEANLGASEARYRRLIETTTEGVLLLDAEARVTFANVRMATMLGYPTEEIVGRHTLDFVDQDKRIASAKVLEARLQGSAGQSELALRRKDGTCLWVLLESSPILDEQGKPEGILGMFTDLTERKRVEEALRHSDDQLRQAQKMEAIGRLAGGIAHDFNNLLSVIMTYSELGMQSLRPGDPLRSDLDEIRKAGERAAGLTKQLLAFSRKQVLEPRIVNLNELITGASKMLVRLIGEDVEVTTVSAESLGSVRADPGQLEQVLMNLAVNARDAMPSGGKLTIETANIELTADNARDHFGVVPGPYVMVAVSDNGCGMDKATQARVFEPFFTTKEAGKGTGLGLSTVFGIVHQSGGHVWVYSEPGKGTTFKVYFPRTDEAVTPAEAPASELTALHGAETILLVEDEEQIRVMVHNLLRTFGYRILEAKNGGEALLISERHPTPIDLLLTDVVMPFMNGAELAKRLNVARPAMKVLCMSGYAEQATINHGILVPGLAFIQKPLTSDKLVRKIREVLGSPGRTTATPQRD